MTEALGAGPIQVRIGLHTGTPLLDRRGLRRRRRPPRRRVAAVGARRPGRRSPRRPRELVELELTDLGEHRLKDIAEAVADLPARRRRLPAAEDDLEHEPARGRRAPSSAGSDELAEVLVADRGRGAARHADRPRRHGQDAARDRGRRRRSCPSTRPASSGSGSPRSAIPRSSPRRSRRRSAPRTGSPSTSASGSCCSCSTTSSR